MSDEHETLVQRASLGEDVAIEGLLERHLPGLRAFIRLRSSKVVRDRESCSDLAQSVCREVLANLDGFEFRGEAEFRAWLFEKGLSKAVDRARYYLAQKRDVLREVRVREAGSSDSAGYESYYASVVTPSRDAVGRENWRRLEEAFDELPDDQREVITLARVVGLSRKEIAAKLGRTEGSVRGLLDRGLARLSWILADDEPDGD